MDLSQRLATQPLLFLDGGAGTHLEALGCDLNHPLWTAKILKEQPEQIVQLHKDYFAAGADIGESVSYQATVEGFVKEGLDEPQAIALLKSSVTHLLTAREQWWQESGQASGRRYPLVAASIGPYGAFLADGSEYRGDYQINAQQLHDFHRHRIEILWQQGVDILAVETIPCLEEAQVIADIVQSLKAKCWITFSAKNKTQISDGQAIAECVQALEHYDCIQAIGINCTAPETITSLLGEIKNHTSKALIAYGNLGDHYDPDTKTWQQSQHSKPYQEHIVQWQALGVRIVGGCCGTTPATIKSIATQYSQDEKSLP